MVSKVPAIVKLVTYVIEGITDVELLGEEIWIHGIRVCQETKCSFITGFRELKQIKSLVFLHGFDLTFPFHAGVLPILRVNGYTLECLRVLPPVPSGKVHWIIACCLNIQELFLSIDDSDSDIAEQVADQSSFYPPKEDLRSHEAAPIRMLETLKLDSSSYSAFAISPELVFMWVR